MSRHRKDQEIRARIEVMRERFEERTGAETSANGQHSKTRSRSQFAELSGNDLWLGMQQD